MLSKSSAIRTFLKVFLFTGIAGLCLLTTIGYFSLSTLINAQAEARYEKQTKQLTSQIGERMETHADVLYRARAFVLVNRTPTQAEWETFFANQEVFHQEKGVDAVSFSRYQSGPKQSIIEQSLSRQHKTVLQITPAGERPEYLPIVVVATASPTASKAIGFDLLSEPLRKATITEARNSGKAALTPPISLVPDNERAVLMVLPVYVENNQLYGFISAVYYTDSFMRGIFDTEVSSGLATEIVDTTSQQEVFKSPINVKGATTTRNDKIAISGREWLITYAAPSQVFGDGHLVPYIVVIVGSVFIIGSLITARAILKLTEPQPDKNKRSNA
jgi:two-component system, sensor histidine kinase